MSHLPKTTDNIGKIAGRVNNQDKEESHRMSAELPIL